ncbi:MAG TPA: hypothetical protein VJ779_00270 [Acetobacteraceae bacterium]|nr:hypothetical protein [Acetobacteraceae bacterium]
MPEMKTIMTTAALLTVLGGGVALAQGAPPGYGNWQSGWRGAAEAQQAQAMAAPRANTTRPNDRAALARNSGSASLAGEAQRAYRGG